MNNTNAQDNLLSRRISLSATDIPLKQALLMIGKQAKVNFSYNAESFSGDSIVSIQVTDKRIEPVLNTILGKSVKYKVAGSHIILLKKADIKPKKEKHTPYSITGYIIDARTGLKIQSATIYDIEAMSPLITNNEGYYSLEIEKNIETRSLSFSKKGYLDTVIIIKPDKRSSIDIYLHPEKEEISLLEPRQPELELEVEYIHSLPIVNLVVPDLAVLHSENLEIYEVRRGQVSLLPFAGTNRMASGAINNNMSLNILSGYSNGVRGVEIGGLLNINNSNVRGVQIGGLGNIVNKSTSGVQVAGLMNINSGNVNGMQIAGFNNIAIDSVNGIQVSGFNNILKGEIEGAQLSGFSNIANNVNGVQISGFSNIGKNVDGLQICGFSNILKEDMEGIQISGFNNIANNVQGLQVSGFNNIARNVKGLQVTGFSNITFHDVDFAQVCGLFNYCKNMNGLQIAGLLNVATKENNGVQIAGLVNYAKKVKGCQLSAINICDTIEGVSIGFLCLVNKGFKTLEISADEIFDYNLSFKTGTRYFHNKFGIRKGKAQESILGASYGIGSSLKLGNKSFLSFEASSTLLMEKGSHKNRHNLLNQISITYEFTPFKHFSITAGPVLNFYIGTLTNDEAADYIPDIALNPFYENTNTSLHQMWVGGKIGIMIW